MNPTIRSALVLLIGVLLGMTTIAVQNIQRIEASGANGCVTIGEVGSVSVAHCVDDANGREMYVSSNGFITPVEE